VVKNLFLTFAGRLHSKGALAAIFILGWESDRAPTVMAVGGVSTPSAKMRIAGDLGDLSRDVQFPIIHPSL
jgi:hypothetical protein